VYGSLRVADGQAVTLTALSCNSIGYQQLLAANPAGTIVVITDNLSSHTSASTRTWLLDHPASSTPSSPRVPAGSTSRRGWWRLVRRQALAGQCFATPEEIILNSRVATCRLNARARPWVRPAPSPRYRRHTFTYRIEGT
jgi:hypothetical protein